MPKMTRDKKTKAKKPKQSELPGTLKRSSAKAQRTFAETHDAAAEQHGDGEAAHRIAFASLKHSFEKVGDHWEPKRKKGPSDAQDAKTGAAARRGGKTAGGVDVLGHTRQELLDRAKGLDIVGRHDMNKEELGRAIASREASRSRPRSSNGSRSRSSGRVRSRS